MNQRIKLRFYISAMLILMAILVALASPVDAAPPLPQPLPETGNCYYDNIFYGAVPVGGDDSPVLVFVHGYQGLASDWWVNVPEIQVNDMYEQAYEAGYRTAFVNLNVDSNAEDCAVERRPAMDALYNGFVLSQQLERIIQHYSVNQVDLIAHSKGGIDAQAAIVWWEAWPWVRNVFTLGSPHQGSLLADLLWSPEGMWVSIVLGQQDDATFSLQTGWMQLFRTITDTSPFNETIKYYSGAGNFWQTPDSVYLLTGPWLQTHPNGGDNDGVVTVASTYLPGATTLFLGPWNHAEVYIGKNAFPYIHEILLNEAVGDFRIYLPLIQSSAMADNVLKVTSFRDTTGVLKPIESNFILRGGQLNDSVTELVVPIEPQARAAKFMLFTTDEKITATLLGPNNFTHPLQSMPNDAPVMFGSASQLGYALSQSSPGQWVIQINGSTPAAYLLIVILDSQIRVGLEGVPDRLTSPGEAVILRAWADNSTGLAQVNQIRLHAGLSSLNSAAAHREWVVISMGSTLTQIFTEEGLYGISMTVTGQTTGGLPFERSFVRSLAVVPTQSLTDGLTVLDTIMRR